MRTILFLLPLLASGCCVSKVPPILHPAPTAVMGGALDGLGAGGCKDDPRCGASLHRQRAVDSSGKVYRRVRCTEFISEVGMGGVLYWSDLWETVPPDGRRYTPSLASEELDDVSVIFVGL